VYCLQYTPRYVALITLIIPFLIIFAACIVILVIVILKTVQMNRSVGDLQDVATKKKRKQRSLRFFGAISVLMGIWRLPLFFGLIFVAITPDPKDIPTGVRELLISILTCQIPYLMCILSWEGMIVNIIYAWYFEIFKSVRQRFRVTSGESTEENALASQDLRLASGEDSTMAESTSETDVNLDTKVESISEFK
jgi:hypothetical protein